MKKLSILLALFTLFLVSCEEEEDTSYNKADLLGKWEQVSPDPQEDAGDCTDYHLYIEFSDTTYKSITACEGSETSMTMEYEFDGKVVSYSIFGIEVTMTIKELSDTKLVVEESAMGETGTAEYSKVTE